MRIDEEHKIANVIVPERQLSLAIGKEGQNARLAAKLTGWRIDIRSEAGVASAAAGSEHPDGDGEHAEPRRRRRCRSDDLTTSRRGRVRSAASRTRSAT